LLAAARLELLRPGALLAGFGAVLFHTVNHWIDVNAANGSSNADLSDAILLTVLTLAMIAPLHAALRKETSCESSWQAHRAQSAGS
jgi:hypothetical protein